MKGIACPDCNEFYKTIGLEGKTLCECTSRHRSNKEMNPIQDHHYSQ